MSTPANEDCGRPSLLTPIGYQSGDCGYCKGDNTSRTPDSRASYYARSKSLCPRHYQLLMDRGWRRSGELLYLPDASRSCCPHYTIRLPASQLKPIRDQRQAINRWTRYVLGEDYLKEVSIKYPKSKEEKKSSKTTFHLLPAIHEPEHPNIKPATAPPAHHLSITLEPDTFTEEKFALFSNYQRAVHHESDAEITRQGFKRFLCSSPLHRHESATSKPSKLGSYHQLYRLDGRLIALSVLDLLPHAVSGVYFIYHSDFEKWSLGKLSALREAAIAIEEGYEWLYMGYYIHSCKKMRYKADYRPQYVLDYDTGSWDLIDEEMKKLMDERKWVSMSRERRIVSLLSSPSTQLSESDLITQLYTPHHPTPLLATSTPLSLLSLSVPGTLSLHDLQTSGLELEDLRATIHGYDGILHMRDLVPFAHGEGDVLDPMTLRGVVAEFVAAVGVQVAGDVVVDWRFG